MKKLYRLTLILGCGLTIFAFQNCSDVQFATSVPTATNSKIGGLNIDANQIGVNLPTDSGNTTTPTCSQEDPNYPNCVTTPTTPTPGTGDCTDDDCVVNNPPDNGGCVGEDCDTETPPSPIVGTCSQEDPNYPNCTTTPPPGTCSGDDCPTDNPPTNVCKLSDEELESLILKVNVKEAFLDQTPVKVLTGSQNLLQLSAGEVGIVTTASSDAHELRLVLAEDGNEIVGSSEQSFVLKTPSGQQSGLKIKLGDGNQEFAGPQSYIIKFSLDIDTQVVSAGNSGKCILKPVLKATEVVAVQ